MGRFLFKIGIVLGLTISIAALAIWYLLIGPKDNHLGNFYNKDKNAVWIAHSWVEDRHSEAEIKQLAQRLTDHHIQYVYVHSGPVESNGSISAKKYPQAESFLKLIKTYNQNIKYLAWFGQIRSELPYQDAKVQETMAFLSQFFVYNLGFDGIHMDIEPVLHNDEAFLLLLKSIKSKIGQFKILSVAADEWQPHFISKLISKLIGRPIESYWGTDDFKNVGKIADQIVIMTYDTGMTRPFTYQWLVAQQVIYVTKAVSGKEVLIGIPTYTQEKPSFHPVAENMTSGLKGIVDGLNNWRSNKETFTGVAIYPEWETDEAEWKVYDELWLGKK